MHTKTMEPSVVLPRDPEDVPQVTNWDRAAERNARGWSIDDTAQEMSRDLGACVSHRWVAAYEAQRLERPRRRRVRAYNNAISRHRKQPWWRAVWRAVWRWPKGRD